MNSKTVIEQFKAKYGTVKFFVMRAPGRVNLIGEHTDYNGYPVMPMAINREILVCASPAEDGKITIANSDHRFRDRSFSVLSPIQPYPAGDWGNYVKAAIVGLLSIIKEKGSEPKGFSALFSGNVPLAAGLSSSSAMVVASALTFLRANDIELPALELAEILARAERFVGTEGGGMDQAISLMGKKDHALKIDFFPLRTSHIPLPEDYRVVICNSLIRAPKTEEARQNYNRRPVECRIATALLTKNLQKHTDFSTEPKRLADLNNRKLKLPVHIYKSVLEETFTQPVVTIEQLCEKLDLTGEEIADKYLILKSGQVFHPPADGFKIAQRYRHVISEANRVELAAQALAKNDVREFGRLMNASHQSCRDDYEISVPELDELVEIARNHGAIGARLTGAGFGGCTVNLIAREKVDSFIEGVRADYYQNYLTIKHPSLVENNHFEDTIFSSPAVRGAEVVDVDGMK